MIDTKTRRKIIKLKEEGCSNTEIKKRTGVSLPTIKKILNEDSFTIARTRPSQNNLEVDSIGDLKERLGKIERSIDLFQNGMNKERASPKYLLHQFTLNFIRALPQAWANGNRWKMLSQGVAPRHYKAILGAIVDSEIVAAVDRQIRFFSPLPGKIFGVKVSAYDGKYDVNVDLIMDEG